MVKNERNHLYILGFNSRKHPKFDEKSPKKVIYCPHQTLVGVGAIFLPMGWWWGACGA